MPNGSPEAANPEGTVMAGNPQEVQGPWNMVLPVLVRSGRDGVGIEGVRRLCLSISRVCQQGAAPGNAGLGRNCSSMEGLKGLPPCLSVSSQFRRDAP